MEVNEKIIRRCGVKTYFNQVTRSNPALSRGRKVESYHVVPPSRESIGQSVLLACNLGKNASVNGLMIASLVASSSCSWVALQLVPRE
jgi:hypothetical protein